MPGEPSHVSWGRNGDGYSYCYHCIRMHPRLNARARACVCARAVWAQRKTDVKGEVLAVQLRFTPRALIIGCWQRRLARGSLLTGRGGLSGEHTGPPDVTLRRKAHRTRLVDAHPHHTAHRTPTPHTHVHPPTQITHTLTKPTPTTHLRYTTRAGPASARSHTPSRTTHTTHAHPLNARAHTHIHDAPTLRNAHSAHVAHTYQTHPTPTHPNLPQSTPQVSHVGIFGRVICFFF